jgi:hypothetical protein
VRLIELIIHAVVGLHPAVWWSERQIRATREDACDDWATNVTGSARGYAACLTKLASLPVNSHDSLLLPAALSSSRLTKRVVRLLDSGRNTSTRKAVVAPLLTAVALSGIALAAASVELVAAQPLIAAARARVDVTLASFATPVATESLPARRPSSRTGRQGEPAPRANTAGPSSSGAASVSDRPGNRERVQERTRAAEKASPDIPATPPLAVTPNALPGLAAPMPELHSTPPDSQSNTETKPATPWGTAADAGVSVGRGSKKAAVATAGFFSRMGKSIAGAF